MVPVRKVAVVSGASYGIGAAITRLLLRKDFKVYGISRTLAKIDDPRYLWIKADLTNQTEIGAIPVQIKEKSINLLVNNVGTAIHEDVLKYSDENFEKIFGLNFKAPIKLTLALYPKLANGLIINISSLSDRFPDGLYSSSKAALNHYFEAIATEDKSLRVINLLPSYVDTPLLRSLHKDDKDFSWESVNSSEQIAEFVGYVIDNPTRIESGSRVVVVSSAQDDGDYDPEKLWLFITDQKKLTRLK